MMELEGEYHRVPAMSGIAIPPSVRHQARNDSNADVHFLVASAPRRAETGLISNNSNLDHIVSEPTQEGKAWKFVSMI